MRKYISMVLFSGFLSSCSQDKVVHGEKKQFRYYDFDVQLEVINPWVEGPEEKYFIENTQNGFYDESTKVWMESKLKPKVLYWVTYQYTRDQNNSSISVQIDTIKSELSDFQLDIVYSLTTEIFRLNNQVNISQDSIKPSLLNHHGNKASVLLDLGNRGDLYKANIKIADPSRANMKVVGPPYFGNKKYKALYDYLKNITNH
ncbi:MAG: hypothetical protein ACO1OF_16575 [Adhaeribacter sp.]